MCALRCVVLVIVNVGVSCCHPVPCLVVGAVAALTALGCFWALAAFVLRTRKWARRPVFFRRWLMQHVVMSVVILLYFLYTTTTREIISLFSCQQVDDPVRLPQEAYGDLPRSPENPLYQEALVALPYQSSSWLYGYWTSDTNVRCGSAAHIGLVVGLGVPGVLFFALGLPIGLWVLLWRISKQQVDGRNRLEEQEVRTVGLCSAAGGRRGERQRRREQLQQSLGAAADVCM